MQVSFLLWVQSWGNPLWDLFFKTITNLGSDSIYIVFIAWLYWCVDRKDGEKWTYLVLSSAMLNGIIKLSFLAPRPFEVGQGIVAVDTSTATGHSFPSGHSQASAAFGSFLAMEYTQKWIKAIGIAMFIAIGTSRLYLRVHWPSDVLVGWALGIFMAWLFHKYYEAYPNRMKALVFLLFATTALFFRDPDQIKLMGLFMTATFGMWLNERHLMLPTHDFKNGGKIKLALGLVCVIATMVGLKLILPEELNMLRYGLVGLMLSLIYPWLFSQAHLRLNRR